MGVLESLSLWGREGWVFLFCGAISQQLSPLWETLYLSLLSPYCLQSLEQGCRAVRGLSPPNKARDQMARRELSWNEAPDGSQGLGGQGGSIWGQPGHQGNHWAYREGHQAGVEG